MLLIDTFIAQSHISGIGLFTNQTIEQGTVISKFHPGLEIYIYDHAFNALQELNKNFFRKQAFHFDKYNYYFLPGGNERFINHSQKNNLTLYADYQNYKSGEPNCMVSLVDIPSGHELTLNYIEFDRDQYGKIVNHIELRDAKSWPPKIQLKK